MACCGWTCFVFSSRPLWIHYVPSTTRRVKVESGMDEKLLCIFGLGKIVDSLMMFVVTVCSQEPFQSYDFISPSDHWSGAIS